MLEFLKSPNGARLQTFLMTCLVAILVHYFPDVAPFIAAGGTAAGAMAIKRVKDHK
jgi:hypothetical protein